MAENFGQWMTENFSSERLANTSGTLGLALLWNCWCADALTIHRTELARLSLLAQLRATLHAARVAWPLARCAFGMVPGSGRGFQITTPWRGKPSGPSI
jgi:hypothetical protein